MIRYCIYPHRQGYRLTIWEPAPLTDDRIQPFHFKLHFTTNSALEAVKILNLIPGRKAEECSSSVPPIIQDRQHITAP